MEWGKDWLEPIQARLGARFPSLSAAELEAYNDLCRKSMFFGHEQVVVTYRRREKDQTRHFERFGAAVRAEYPWVSSDNLSQLFSQGCYYAMK